MILARSELAKQGQLWREAGLKVIFTNGCFDLLHSGHVQYLTEARALGDLLVVGLNSDASVQALKGPRRPLVGQEARASVMSALRPVDHVVIFEEYTAQQVIAELKPEIYVKGGDYSASESQPSGKPLPEAATVRSYGGEVVLIPFLPGYSTTELINKIVGLYGHSNP